VPSAARWSTADWKALRMLSAVSCGYIVAWVTGNLTRIISLGRFAIRPLNLSERLIRLPTRHRL
jgi:hypothetical protein